MATPPDPGDGYRGTGSWPLITLGLLAAGWVALFLTQGYAARLAEQWGPAPDVVDALGRDRYVSRGTLPYYTVMVLLDGLAAGSLAARSRPGWPRVLKVLDAVVLVPSALLHGLVWLLTAFFAA